ncbi:MAG: hypothetical protein KBD56_08165 [Candidatus Eisenbacteria bacterium]|nr:hypothetical protein [Candidatus Eisenbacteria bacterium]
MDARSSRIVRFAKPSPPKGAMVLAAFLSLAVAFVAGGCEKEKSCPVCPASGIRLDEIYRTADSLALGGEVGLWALPDAAGQSYAWSASVGTFTVTDGNYAAWKAPDVSGLAEIRVVASNAQNESKALSVTLAVATYLPRHLPSYTGASYCGLECHGTKSHGDAYDTWIETRHARGFAAVEQHPEYTPEGCAQCHTVGYGDQAANEWPLNNGGYDEVPVARLAGVQCENCHGPMADRYGSIPDDHLALSVNDSLYAADRMHNPRGCAQCHESYASAAHPQGPAYMSEWASGAHASIPLGVDTGQLVCSGCHTAQGFIARMDGHLVPISADPMPVTCVACHDPHGTEQRADLRAPEGRVCAACHSDERNSYPRDPHSPQTQMLAGTGGFENLAPGPLSSTPHQQVLRRGCEDCHYPAGDPDRSHDFRARPTGCMACHPQASDADFAWAEPKRAEIRALLQTLESELASATPADSATAVFQQAQFNWSFVSRDRSDGAHNYEYARDLLQRSIDAFTPGMR